MKISTTNAALKTAVDKIVGLVGKSSFSCIEGIKVQANSDNVYLYAISPVLESFAKVLIAPDETRVFSIGETFIRHEDIDKVLFTKGIFIIETDEDGRLKVYNNKKKSELMSVTTEDFPSFPSVKSAEENKIIVIENGTGFCSALKVLDEYRSSTEPNPLYECYNLRSDLKAIATLSGCRLAMKTLQGFTDKKVNININGRVGRELPKIIGKSDNEVVLYSDSKFAKFVGNDFEYYVRLEQGDYMDYEKAIPSGRAKARFTFSSTRDVIDALKEYKKCKPPKKTGWNPPVILTDYNNNILSCYRTQSYNTIDCLETIYTGNHEEVCIGVNPEFLLSALSLFDKNGSDYVITYWGQTSPLILTDEDYTIVIVPKHIDNNREKIISEFEG